MLQLAFANPESELEVKQIVADEKTSRFLNSMGLIKGSKLSLLNCHRGDCIVRMKESKLALNRTMAMKIWVE